MNALLNNDCISFFDLDDNCENCEGLIYFCGDIIYSGEIENNLPQGFGTLKLNDGSTFQGNFNKGKFVDGVFKHYSGIVFEGQFNKDRLQKGKIQFIDGEVLEGQFCLKRNKWGLKKGNLYKEDKTLIGKLSEKNNTISSSLKTINCHCSSNSNFIEYQYFYNNKGEAWEPFLVNADLSTCVTTNKGTQIQKIFFNLDQILYNKEEIYENKVLSFEKYQIFMGQKLTIQKSKGQNNWNMSIENIENIQFCGQFEFDKPKFFFKGYLYIDNEKKGQVQIQTFLFNKIQIEYEKDIFNNFKKFLQCILQLYPQIKINLPKRKQKSDAYNKIAVKSIIDDLKAKDDCRIF